MGKDIMSIKWISVEEKLPDGFYTVIVWVNNASKFYKKGTTFAYLFEGKEWVMLEEGKFTKPQISHWMPLPKGPNED